MSLDKAIRHGKERRRPYRGAKSFDRSCCNNRSCSYCRSNRLAANRRRIDAATSAVAEWEREEVQND